MRGVLVVWVGDSRVRGVSVWLVHRFTGMPRDACCMSGVAGWMVGMVGKVYTDGWPFFWSVSRFGWEVSKGRLFMWFWFLVALMGSACIGAATLRVSLGRWLRARLSEDHCVGVCVSRARVRQMGVDSSGRGRCVVTGMGWRNYQWSGGFERAVTQSLRSFVLSFFRSAAVVGGGLGDGQ